MDPSSAKDTARAISVGARASAILSTTDAGHQITGYHAEPPGEETLAEIAKLLDFDTVDALILNLVSVMNTVSTVIERTAAREQVIMGGDGLFVSINGIRQALTMSLSDFVIALATTGGIDMSEADKVADVLDEERKDRTAEKKNLILP